MKVPTKRVGRAPLKNDAAAASKLLKTTSEEAVVQHLQHVLAELHRLPLPTGRVGCQFLDCLELVDQIALVCAKRLRNYSSRNRASSPTGTSEETPQWTLSRDTARVFEALPREDDTLSPERFIEA